MGDIYKAFCIGCIGLTIYCKNEAVTLFTLVFTAPYWFEWICRKAGVK